MSLLLSRYCTLLLPELQASEDNHGAFILRTWSSMSVLSIRFRYYMSAHEGPSRYSKSPVSGNFEPLAALRGELSEIPVSRELGHFKLAAASKRIHFADTPNLFTHTRA